MSGLWEPTGMSTEFLNAGLMCKVQEPAVPTDDATLTQDPETESSANSMQDPEKEHRVHVTLQGLRPVINPRRCHWCSEFEIPGMYFYTSTSGHLVCPPCWQELLDESSQQFDEHWG